MFDNIVSKMSVGERVIGCSYLGEEHPLRKKTKKARSQMRNELEMLTADIFIQVKMSRSQGVAA